MKAWPFLFSRGYVLGNQLVVCPRILKEGGRWNEFSRTVARLSSDPRGNVKIEEVENAKLGGITLIYREHYAARNGEPLRDVAGRLVPEIRGLMIEGRCASKVSALAEAAIARAAHSLDVAFESFWDRDEESDPTFFDGIEVGQPVREPQPSPTGTAGKMPKTISPRHLVTAVVLAALVPCMLTAGLFYWHYAATTKRLADLEATAKNHHEILDKLAKDVEGMKSADNSQ